MLRTLQIRDFVIVDRLELDFGAGFGALTGETGAGKSILLDALSLALGARAEAGIVRVGCDRAEISADFAMPPDDALATWLEEQGLPAAPDGVLMRRVVEAGGRSRAWINGSPVTLAQLRDLGDALVDGVEPAKCGHWGVPGTRQSRRVQAAKRPAEIASRAPDISRSR